MNSLAHGFISNLGGEKMKTKELRSNILLLLTATIWGFAFVAQRVGAGYVGSFTFNGIRFALGSLSLVPLLIFLDRNSKEKEAKAKEENKGTLLKEGAILGSVLFLGSTFQQIGLSYTTAGKAGFITGFYIVLVPLMGIFLKQKIKWTTWAAVFLALIGLYFLSVKEGFTVSKGDLLELIGAFFWAAHIQLIDKFTKKFDALKLSVIQFAACSILSLIAAFCFETITLKGLYGALIPILYGGLGSVGIAYTLQVVAQKNAKPSHAAIILSMESLFAAIGGFLILNENLGARGIFGCGLMLGGMLLSQVRK